ncbi:MAG: transcriptional repressor [Arcobacteraceae bacterium]|jgi:Fur family ferric uptake transcriptional regulator|nr:transcriptional repressor [Arcobacteraceae bacterium]MDY0327771.1 Fur family transcriptional regulator [Arcobacteraceae bacterium]
MQNDDKLLEDFKDLLKKKGMKFTEQRAIILQILFSIDGHLNAEEVHDVVKKDYPDSNIGIATVYRTLGFLEEANLITSISFGTDGKKYEGNKKKHHDHLICTKCGKIVEFMDNEIEKKQEQIAKKNGFDITSHNMQIFGICSDCQKK